MKLFDEDALMQMAAIAQSTPGAIAINLSALAGYQTAGFFGAAISCVAAGVAALIVDLVVQMFQMILKENSRLLTFMVPCAFAANFSVFSDWPVQYR